jgi:hypothetical protein
MFKQIKPSRTDRRSKNVFKVINPQMASELPECNDNLQVIDVALPIRNPGTRLDQAQVIVLFDLHQLRAHSPITEWLQKR